MFSYMLPNVPSMSIDIRTCSIEINLLNAPEMFYISIPH